MGLNWWEFKNCGRELGGKYNRGAGVYPAATDTVWTAFMVGRTRGAYWMTADTFAGGSVQGTFGTKYKTCELSTSVKILT